MNNKSCCIIYFLIFRTLVVGAQIDQDAWRNFKNSQYELIEGLEEQDAILIFDRNYFHTVIENANQVAQIVITHRKIKINTLTGLEAFNKMYIATFNDLHYKSKILDIKAKTLKANAEVVENDTSRFIHTTLPANVPFFYKKSGTVKMLALKDVSIGDEIEYIYQVKHVFDGMPHLFNQARQVTFENLYHCLEKSLFFESDYFDIKIKSQNFGKNLEEIPSVGNKKRQKISLYNIKNGSDELYTNTALQTPYIQYLISRSIDDTETSWEIITRSFKTRQNELKWHNIAEAIDKNIEGKNYLFETKSISEKFQLLLNDLNKPLERNFNLYDELKEDIDLAWNSARYISKLMKKMKIPVGFHFAVNKELGTFDPDYLSFYQFHKVYISFIDENGKKRYLPLIQPYSKLDEIEAEYQGTNCFTIKQDEYGKRSFVFDTIPINDLKSERKIDIKVKLKSLVNDTLTLAVHQKLSISNAAFLRSKPYIMNYINDSTEGTDQLRKFVYWFLPISIHEDSIIDLKYTLHKNSIELTFSYRWRKEVLSDPEIISLKPEMFIAHDFYTPYHLRENRALPGYLYNESNLNYYFEFDFDHKYQWMENSLMTTEIQNPIGDVKVNYTESSSPKMNFILDWKTDQFKKENWTHVLQLRDQSLDFLGSRLFFKKKK